MKREVYESQKAFAGEKKPSMLRRCVGHDYTERMMYMVTMVVEGRRPLFGTVVGRSDAPADSEQAPRVELSELGRRVSEEMLSTPAHHPEISVIALQMMPDHLHAILFVKEKMEEPLGMALRGFKQKCNRNKQDKRNKQDGQHRRKTAEVKTAPTAFSLPAASMTSYCCAKVSYSAGWTICTTTRAVC